MTKISNTNLSDSATQDFSALAILLLKSPTATEKAWLHAEQRADTNRGSLGLFYFFLPVARPLLFVDSILAAP
jgi:hypothetical protein